MNIYIYGSQSFKKEIHQTLEHANIRFKLGDNTLINDNSNLKELKEIIKNRPNIILLGDSLSDIRMAGPELKENALKIGFLEENLEENLPKFKEQFDIVGTDNTSYVELLKEIQL